VIKIGSAFQTFAVPQPQTKKLQHLRFDLTLQHFF